MEGIDPSDLTSYSVVDSPILSLPGKPSNNLTDVPAGCLLNANLNARGESEDDSV